LAPDPQEGAPLPGGKSTGKEKASTSENILVVISTAASKKVSQGSGFAEKIRRKIR
jgi:hypothetical protein